MGKLLREHYNRIDLVEEAVEGFLIDNLQNNIASNSNSMAFGAGNNAALAGNNMAFGAGNNAAFGAGNNAGFSAEVNAAIDAAWGNLPNNFNGTNNSGFVSGGGANNGGRNRNSNGYFDFTGSRTAGGFSAETNAAIDAAWGNLDNSSLSGGGQDNSGVMRSPANPNSLQNSGA
eukprot:TRINITY_DN15630_c0_g1_i3.p1 TRINITY_DN15630_c0_g1~~TRINITY_DN15630_c0_g1_i3.p1  ORF type:complete len:174 (+),score=52.02 TRINITY_DN15630_c0_g1_i3:137-658(+)